MARIVYRDQNFQSFYADVNAQQPEVTIGRNEGNMLRIMTKAVSRFHAKVVFQNGRYYFIDNNSSNGCYVNNMRIKPMEPFEIRPGDVLRCGESNLEFSELPGAAPQPGMIRPMPGAPMGMPGQMPQNKPMVGMPGQMPGQMPQNKPMVGMPGQMPGGPMVGMPGQMPPKGPMVGMPGQMPGGPMSGMPGGPMGGQMPGGPMGGQMPGGPMVGMPGQMPGGSLASGRGPMPNSPMPGMPGSPMVGMPQNKPAGFASMPGAPKIPMSGIGAQQPSIPSPSLPNNVGMRPIPNSNGTFRPTMINQPSFDQEMERVAQAAPAQAPMPAFEPQEELGAPANFEAANEPAPVEDQDLEERRFDDRGEESFGSSPNPTQAFSLDEIDAATNDEGPYESVASNEGASMPPMEGDEEFQEEPVDASAPVSEPVSGQIQADEPVNNGPVEEMVDHEEMPIAPAPLGDRYGARARGARFGRDSSVGPSAQIAPTARRVTRSVPIGRAGEASGVSAPSSSQMPAVNAAGGNPVNNMVPPAPRRNQRDRGGRMVPHPQRGFVPHEYDSSANLANEEAYGNSVMPENVLYADNHVENSYHGSENPAYREEQEFVDAYAPMNAPQNDVAEASYDQNHDYDDAVPMEDDAVPMADDAVPMADDAVPMADDAVPMADDAVPMADDAVPMADDAVPMADEGQDAGYDTPLPVTDARSVVDDDRDALANRVGESVIVEAIDDADESALSDEVNDQNGDFDAFNDVSVGSYDDDMDENELDEDISPIEDALDQPGEFLADVAVPAESEIVQVDKLSMALNEADARDAYDPEVNGESVEIPAVVQSVSNLTCIDDPRSEISCIQEESEPQFVYAQKNNYTMSAPDLGAVPDPAALEIEVTQLRTRLKAAEHEAEKLGVCLEKTMAERDDVLEKVGVLENEVATLKESLSVAKEARVAAENELRAVHDGITESDDARMSAEAEMSDLREQMADVEKNCLEAEKAQAMAERAAEEMSALLERAQKAQAEAEAERAEALEQAASALQQCDNAEVARVKAESELGAANEELEKLRDQVSELKLDIETVQAQCAQAQNSVAGQDEAVASLTQQLGEAQNVIAANAANAEALQQQLVESQNQAKALQDQVDEYQACVSRQNAELDELRAESNANEEEIVQLRAQLDASNEAKGDFDGQIMALNDKLGEVCAENLKLQQELVALRDELEASNDEKTRHFGEIQDLRSKLNEASESSTNSGAEVAELKQELEKAREENVYLETQIENLKEELDSTKEEFNLVQSSLNMAQSANEITGAELEQLRAEAVDAGNQISALRAEIAEMQNAAGDIEALRAAADEAKERVAALEAESAQLRAERDEANASLSSNSIQIESLRSLLASAQNNPAVSSGTSASEDFVKTWSTRFDAVIQYADQVVKIVNAAQGLDPSAVESVNSMFDVLKLCDKKMKKAAKSLS